MQAFTQRYRFCASAMKRPKPAATKTISAMLARSAALLPDVGLPVVFKSGLLAHG